MALNLTRAVGQSLLIGKDVVLTVLEIRGSKVRFGFTAPPNVTIKLGKKDDIHTNDHPTDSEPPQRPAG